MRVKDIDIRKCLYSELENYFCYDSSTKFIDELQICNGIVRVDLAAINGSFYGYEIKSESDTLDRLPNQIEHYNKVFDYMFIVCSESYVEQVSQCIPDWWGIYIAKKGLCSISLNMERAPKHNTSYDLFSLLQFLRKDEVVQLLKDNNLLDSITSKMPKYKLWHLASESINLDTIISFVQTTLKTRPDWRTRSLQMLNDG